MTISIYIPNLNAQIVSSCPPSRTVADARSLQQHHEKNTNVRQMLFSREEAELSKLRAQTVVNVKQSGIISAF